MNSVIPAIRLQDYHYELPEDRIAQQPLPDRDASNLLQYQAGVISHHIFQALPSLLPSGSLLVFNDTKVIQARLFFRRKSGALIEILLMHPHAPAEVHTAMQASSAVVWSCIIGNKKKWKSGEMLSRTMVVNGKEVPFHASWEDREQQLVRLSWEGDLSFIACLQSAGELPLPPYIHREAREEDLQSYQTIYARHTGAVAAPTAGLHFTDRVMDQLAAKRVKSEYVTLHVSAGTFLPVKTELAVDHDMHHEQMVITEAAVEHLLRHEGPLVAVGTTSMRWLESLYWIGLQLLQGNLPEAGLPFRVEKLSPYQMPVDDLPEPKLALRALQDWMTARGVSQCLAETSIMILPGYPFRLCQGLVTNFHLPGTTLMLLVAAFVGEDWRKIYDAALGNGYRFLSYGDSSLLWKAE